jgi:hypothetical protein
MPYSVMPAPFTPASDSATNPGAAGTAREAIEKYADASFRPYALEVNVFQPQQPIPAPAPYFPATPPPHQGPPFLACRCCGSVPAAQATFRGHIGALVVMRFLSTEGPFCRDCGLGVFRHMTSRTLVQGWYGVLSMIIAPGTVLMNIISRVKVAGLAQPQPHPYAPSRPPMDPGPALLRRPMTWIGFAIPFVLIGVLALADATNP